eukprot:3723019-Prymnesium_polylepis.1
MPRIYAMVTCGRGGGGQGGKRGRVAHHELLVVGAVALLLDLLEQEAVAHLGALKLATDRHRLLLAQPARGRGRRRVSRAATARGPRAGAAERA